MVSSGPQQEVEKERDGHIHPNLLIMLSISHPGHNDRHYLKLRDGSSSFHFFVLFYDVCHYSLVRDTGFITPSESWIY